MNEITVKSPSIVKLGSFGGKVKYCLIDAFVIPLLKIFQLKVHCVRNQLVVVATDGFVETPFHDIIWEYFHQYSIPTCYFVSHRNGIPMDNRLDNLFLTSNDTSSMTSRRSQPLSSFYWQILSNLPVDMDEVDYHHAIPNPSTLYECHNSPCTQLLDNSADEQFICPLCKKIKYCSDVCRTMDGDIHSIFCNPSD